MRLRRRSVGAGSGWSGVGGSGSDATGSAARGRARGGRSGDGRGHLMATSEANDPLGYGQRPRPHRRIRPRRAASARRRRIRRPGGPWPRTPPCPRQRLAGPTSRRRSGVRPRSGRGGPLRRLPACGCPACSRPRLGPARGRPVRPGTSSPPASSAGAAPSPREPAAPALPVVAVQPAPHLLVELEVAAAPPPGLLELEVEPLRPAPGQLR